MHSQQPAIYHLEILLLISFLTGLLYLPTTNGHIQQRPAYRNLSGARCPINGNEPLNTFMKTGL